MKLSPTVLFTLPLVAGLLILGGCATPEANSDVAKKTVAPAKAAEKTPAPAAPAKPVPPPAPKPAPAPAVPVAVAPAAPVVASAPVVPPPPIPNPAKRAEVIATVEHLTQEGREDTMAHELSDSTEFPQAMASLAPGAHAPKSEVIYIGTQPPTKGLTADGNSTDLVEKDWTGLVLVPLNTSLSKAHTSAVRLIKVEAHPLSDGRVRVWMRVKNVGDKALPTEIACLFRMQGESSRESPYFYELDVPGQAFRDVFFVSPSGQLNTYTVLVRPKFNY